MNANRIVAGEIPSHTQPTTPWYGRTFAVAMLGGVLLYAAFPPLNLWPLAWVALLPWVWLVAQPILPGRRPYLSLYAAGLLHWLVLVQWVRLGHWAAHFGWVALVLYLGLYLPLFVSLSRVAVHRLKVPMVIAVPVIWTGLEVARSSFLTGLSLALLGHTQVNWLAMIQISDLFGAYGVSFVIATFAAGLGRLLVRCYSSPERGGSGDGLTNANHALGERSYKRWYGILSLVYAIALVAASLAYGYNHLNRTVAPATNVLSVALVQGSIDAVFGDPTLDQRTIEQYRELTKRDALPQQPDVVIWPESTFPYYRIEADDPEKIQSTLDSPSTPQFRRWARDTQTFYEQVAADIGWLPGEGHVPVILGGSTFQLGEYEPKRYNAAIYIGPEGREVDVYHKMEPIMFGEYVPGGDWFPWVYKLTPFGTGLTPGTEAKVFEVDGLKLVPSICYENTIPHLIRRQVAELRRQGDEPDVLLTLSNDGWFRGSSELDMHLTCGIFRAVEMRKPALIAANTGFSAHVDGDGRVLARGPRRDTDVVMAEVQPDGRTSLYSVIGDVAGNLCLLMCVLVGFAGWFLRRKS